MKTILLPTDFSANSQNAVDYAISMFGNAGIKFILLNAYRLKPVSVEEYVADIPDFRKESEKGLKKMLAYIRKKHGKNRLNIETISKLGYPVETMQKILKRKKADLTVMGTKGATGMREILLGSIAADTIKNLSCPIIIVPEKVKYTKPGNIVFAADFKKIQSTVFLKPLINMAKKFKAEIVMLHIQKTGQKLTREKIYQKIKTEKIFSGIPVSFFITENSNIAEGIENFTKIKEIDMLAMISRKHSFIAKIFNPSITGKLAMHSVIPLLVLPEN